MPNRDNVQHLQRILVSELDSIIQRQSLDASDTPAEFHQETLAQIRSSILLSDKLLLLDSQVLDGVFFTVFTPTKLAQALGLAVHQLPITIFSYLPSLRDALGVRLNNPGFEWQLHKAEGALEYQDWPQARLHSAWNEWIEATESGDIEFVYQEGFRSTEPVAEDSEPPQDLLTSEVAATFMERARGTSLRSAAWQAYVDFWEQNDDAQVRRSLDQAWSWWNFHYQRRLAEHYGVSWVSFRQAKELRRQPSDADVRRLALSERLIHDVAEQSPARYALALERSKNPRHRFIERASPSRLRSVTYAAVAEAGPSSRSLVMWSASVRALFALAAVVLALPVLGGYIGGLTQVWLVFLLTALVTIPYRELGTLWDILRKDENAAMEIRVTA